MKMNKKSSRYRRLMEIRSKNSFKRHGLDPKKSITITTYEGEKQYSYKDQIIIQGSIGIK